MSGGSPAHATPDGDARIERLDADAYTVAIPELADLIVDAVAGGAGVNFMDGVTQDQAAAWWEARRGDVADGSVIPFVARAADGRIVGSAILILSANPNSPHRAEIGKVLVHHEARRGGVGRRLMTAAEDVAKADGRWLLVLDTVTGSAADVFYRDLGWQELGVMPNHAYLPDGRLSDTTYFWKDLR